MNTGKLAGRIFQLPCHAEWNYSRQVVAQDDAGGHCLSRSGASTMMPTRNRLIFQSIHLRDTDSACPVDRLSDRELEVFTFLGRGMGTRDIASELHLSVKTIETHRAHIKEKLGFDGSREMVLFAIDWVAQEKA
jgi:DNA-binding NarL/FixJ family response regulator